MNFHSFSLDPRLQQGIAKAGYTAPTPIQLQAIPAALDGHDIIATAQTGTGKTAAFVLPILHSLLNGTRGRHRALIVTPTRELADQIHQNIRTLSAGTKLRSTVIYGGVNARPQRQALFQGVEILVVCPGRMLDHISRGDARLGTIELLVLDEADRMLDMGFLPDVKRLLSHLPEDRQTMLFSATFPKEIEALASRYLHDPLRIHLSLERPVQTVEHALFPVAADRKTDLLLALLDRTSMESVLVFTRTRHRADRLERAIKQKGFNVTSLHSDRSQSQRQAALAGFREGKFRIMVATDIAARGIDVAGISHVINYDMPDTADTYIHRIGRTGRAEQTGDAYTLVTIDDETLIRQLERIMGEKLRRETLPGFEHTGPSSAVPMKEVKVAMGIGNSVSARPRNSSLSKKSPWSTKSRRVRAQAQMRKGR